jgi:hypothetical protein
VEGRRRGREEAEEPLAEGRGKKRPDMVWVEGQALFGVSKRSWSTLVLLSTDLGGTLWRVQGGSGGP